MLLQEQVHGAKQLQRPMTVPAHSSWCHPPNYGHAPASVATMIHHPRSSPAPAILHPRSHMQQRRCVSNHQTTLTMVVL